MFVQFFGGFLLNKGAVTREQLIDAMERENDAHIQLGTLAMHAGLMNADQIDEIRILQTHTDKRFGELCVDQGYLTEAQVDELLSSQYPTYLLLGQVLEEQGVFDQSTFHALVLEYITKNSIREEDLTNKNEDSIPVLVKEYCSDFPSMNKNYQLEYIQLLLNNLIRFIGSDFTLLRPVIYQDEYATQKYATQDVTGDYSASAVLDMTEDAAIAFASRYASEAFTSFDEYVQASMEDFLNLHNGLFTVNISNSYSTELGLEPPYSGEKTSITSKQAMYVFPALFPFGIVNIVLSEHA